jgi:hypothetical protein
VDFSGFARNSARNEIFFNVSAARRTIDFRWVYFRGKQSPFNGRLVAGFVRIQMSKETAVEAVEFRCLTTSVTRAKRSESRLQKLSKKESNSRLFNQSAIETSLLN